MGALQPHKFDKYVGGDPEFDALPASSLTTKGFLYTVKVYVDDFMSLIIPILREQLQHIAMAVMTGIHDVFPPDADNSNDPISEKKLRQHEGQFSTWKTLLGFEFDGITKTMWLEQAKREKLLTVLKGWVRAGKWGMAGIPFKEFESVTAKLRHAFTCIPAGVGLLSPCNWILQVNPRTVYLHRNKPVLTAIKGCRMLLRESTREPTHCRELTFGWPDYIGIVDASSHGVGGVVVGELSGCVPTVFRWQWPEDIRTQVVSLDNPAGTINNSDLEMAGLLLLWLVIEGICGSLAEKRIALFGDNFPLIGWVAHLGSRCSRVAENLIQALALRLKLQRACPLTPIHIAGERNAIPDVPSCLFGSNPAWRCDTDNDLLTLFNSLFPIPTQHSLTLYHLNCELVTHVISILRTQPFKLDEWRRLPRIGRHVGKIGAHTSNQWGWIRTLTVHRSRRGSDASRGLPNGCKPGSSDTDDKSKVLQYHKLSQPLARQSRWPETLTPQK